MEDSVLLSRYVASGCQESFEAIVARHSGWVFSLSLRAVRDRHLAEDVTQAVFIILARKAPTIRQGTPLSGWLFKASRFAVSDALKRRTRMRNRENRFAEFFKATAGPDGAEAGSASELSDELSGTLDEAVACLSDSDRQAILLRFYEHKSLAEVGAILGVNEEAAKKRVARAVDRLRKYFASRGVVASIALILLLLSRRADAAGFVPAIVAPAAAPSIAHAIADGALQLMARANARLLGAIFAAGLALLIAIPVTLGVDFGGAPATVTIDIDARSRPLPPVPAETVDVASPQLPEQQARFADLWIGYRGELLWRSDAHTADPTVLPFVLKSAEQQPRPYAVAVDPRGDYFIKPLDPGILQSPVVRLGQYGYDYGPVEPPARVNSMLSVIDPLAPVRSALALVDPAPADFSVLPRAGSKRLVDKDWHKLRRSEDEQGNVVIEFHGPAQLDGIIIPGHFGQSAINNSVEVPEPNAVLALLTAAATATLLRRRRPRRSN
jgi:RNA polymerase sigma factor (sigma-70 family)